MKVQFHEVEVGSDLYEAGRSEDGVPFVAEVYFVQVTLASGRRFRHSASWAGAAVSVDDEGYEYFEDVRAAALRSALRLRRRVRRAGRVDLDHWVSARPVYGSAAYSSADEVELERLEEEAAY